MKMRLLLIIGSCIFANATLADELHLYPTQNPNAAYRLFRTHNLYTLLELDTRTGEIWQVQWSFDNTSRFIVPLNLTKLAVPGHLGEFTLYPTINIYTLHTS